MMFKTKKTELTSRQQNRGSNLNQSDHSKRPLLPETVNDIAKNGSFDSGDEQIIPTHAYIILTTAVVALSSIGPSLDLQHGVHPIMKIFWRQTGTYIVLVPFAIHTSIKRGWPTFNFPQAVAFLAAAFCYTVMCLGFVISLEFTSVGNAVIFSNTNALLLLLGRFLVGANVSLTEGGGALLAFLGGVLCTWDAAESEPLAPQAVHEVSPVWTGFIGDVAAVSSALGGLTYLVLARNVRARFPTIYSYVFLNMLASSLFTLSYILLFTNQEVRLSTDIHIGLFGFLNARYDRLPLEMFMVIICNMVGSMGYLRSTQYFDNLVISVATLLEPTVASFLAYSMGVGVLPGPLGWMGNVLVVLGTIAVIDPTSKKTAD